MTWFTLALQVRTFMEASFPDYIIEALEAANFARPTPIQSQAWPIAMSGCAPKFKFD